VSGGFSQRAREVIDLARSVSGHSIEIESDPTLDVWSIARFPRKGETACRIIYHPAREKYLDYIVGHECGHIYRFFSAKPEERILPAMDSADLEKAMRGVSRERWKMRDKLPPDLKMKFLASLCSGLVRHLANTPPDCRIEFWIYNNFVELIDVQAAALGEQYLTMVRCLDPEIRKWTPPAIYRKSTAINYVLGKNTSKLLDEPDLIAPYVKNGFERLGEKLSSYLNDEDRGYSQDVLIADVWANELEVEDWFQWKKLE